MGMPYETASSGERALAELQRVLAKFGCQSFGTMTDAERGMTIVQFKWQGRTVSLEASWKGYSVAWMKLHPFRYRGRRTRATYEQDALRQAQLSVCSVLRDWIKGQVTAVECGVMSFESVFMAHMLLPDGKRMIDRARSEKLLPAPNATSEERSELKQRTK